MKWNIPILGKTKIVTQLKDKDGNEIPLKFETGSYWIPDTFDKHSLEFSLLVKNLELLALSNSGKKRAALLWKKGLLHDLKVNEEDMKEAKNQILKLKKSATMIPKFKNTQVKAGLIKPKSNFIYTVATQGDTGEIWSQSKYKVADLIAERQKWIQGLEVQKAKIKKELKKVTISEK